MTSLRMLSLALAGLVLAGCSILRPPQLFLMEPAPAAERTVAGLETRLIVVPRLSLPAYAADTRIAVLTADEAGMPAVAQAGDRVWADAPERALTIGLSRALAARTGAPVLAEPWPVEAVPDLKIEVVVDRLLGAEGGALALTGVYRVIDLRRNGLAIVRDFDIAAEAPGPGIEGLAAAHALALGRLADAVAAALAERFAS